MLKKLLETAQRQRAVNAEIPPVVTLEEFFRGNSDEESIAPNQWGEGRPSAQQIYTAFKQVESREDVQAILVGLHPDWIEALDDDGLWPAAENVRIYTTAAAETEEWIVGDELRQQL